MKTRPSFRSRSLSGFCLASAFLLSSASLHPSAAAPDPAPVRLLYQSKHRVFEVVAFEDGLPKLEEERIVQGAEARAEKENRWHLEGDLPAHPSFAWPVETFRLRKRSISAKDPGIRPGYEVYPRISGEDRPSWLEGGTESGLFVFGWVSDGELVACSALSSESRRGYLAKQSLSIDADQSDGALYAWRVVEGFCQAREQVDEVEYAAFPKDLAPVSEKDLARKKSENGLTALMLASLYGRSDWVSALLEVRAAKNRRADNDWTALMYAAAAGRSEIVSMLLKAGARENLFADWERTALVNAADYGHLDCVQLLADEKPKGKSEQARYDDALGYSMRRGFPEISIYLSEMGAQINLPTEEHGYVALSLFTNGFPRAGEYFRQKLEVPGDYSRNGYNFLHAVAPYAGPALLQQTMEAGTDMLEETEAGYRPVDLAVGMGNIKGLCWFLDRDADEGRRRGKVDPVFHAIASEQKESVACLIDYGFDMNQSGLGGLNPLMQALVAREPEIARMIHEAGGTLDLDSERFEACLVFAIEMDLAGVVRRALEAGLRRDALLFDSVTLLDAARFYGASETLALLEQRGIDASNLKSLSELTEGPKLVSRAPIAYPYELQKEYGDANFRVEAVIGVAGAPVLVDYPGETPEPLRRVFEQSFVAWRFTPALIDEQAVPIQVGFKVPLVAPLSDEKVFESEAVDRVARPKSHVWPDLPESLREAGCRVHLEVVVGADGQVEHASVIYSSDERAEGPVLESVKATEHEPAMRDGKPVPSRFRMWVSYGGD